MTENCKLVYVDGVAMAFDSDGEKSNLYEKALEYTDGNQEEAIKIWSSTQSEEFSSEVGEEKPSLQTVLRFLNNRVEKPQTLSPQELKEVSLMMSDMGIMDLNEFTQKMNNLFQPNGYYEVDSKKLMKSGMYSVDDITNLNHTEVKGFLERLNYFNEHKEYSLSVAPIKAKVQLRNTTAQKTPIGSFPLVSEQELVEYIIDNSDDLSTQSINRTIGNSPFAQILDNPKAMKAIMGMLNGKRKVNKMFFDGKEFVSNNIDTFVTLRNTLLANADPIELEADLEFIESVTPYVWDNKQKEIKNVLKEIEKTAIKFNIDIIGLSELSNDRDTVLSLLSALDDMLLTPSIENIQNFARKKDEKIAPNKPYTVVQEKEQYKEYNIVKIDTNLSDDIMFQKGFLKIDSNGLYHRIQRAEVADMYEVVYDMVQDNELIVPSEFFDKGLNIKDPVNKEAVMSGIVNYINSRDTGIDTTLVEEVSLMQTIFAHEKLKRTVPQDITSNVSYLKSGFVSDFYNYILEEKQKNTNLYNKVLKYFSITDGDITLDALNIPDITGIKYEQELRDYSRLKKDGQIKDLEQGESKNEDLIVLNNPKKVQEEGNTNYVVGSDEYVLTEPNPKKYIKVGGKLHRKLFDKSNGALYKEIMTPKNPLYFDNNLNFDFNREEAESAHKKLSKSLQKKTVKTAEELSKNVNIPNRIMPIQYQIIGEQGARNLDQVEEATFRMDNLRIAKEMMQAGKTPLEIRLATGWEKGADSLWRYEILDGSLKDVKINFNHKHKFFSENVAKFSLKDLIENDILFKAYPQLNDINVYVYKTKDELLANNKMFVMDNEMFLNIEDYDNKRGGLKFSDGERGDVLHEVQHLLQGYEGFSKGSSQGWAKQRVIDAVVRIREKGLERTKRDGYQSEVDRVVVEILEASPVAHLVDEIFNSDSTIDPEIVAGVISVNIYRRIMGEVEARNVQTRIDMTAEQRRQTLLQETEDVAREYQIFLRNSPQFQIIGEQGASQVAEYRNSLDAAKRMYDQGISLSEIENKTKWYLFKGDWKRMSPESIASFKIKDNTINKIITLKDVLGNENVLFNFYPQLRETKVVFADTSSQNVPVDTPNDFEKSNGIFNEGSNTIVINTRNAKTQAEQEYTLSHEVTHSIQKIEGFPKGGSLTSVLSETMDILRIEGNKPLPQIYQEIMRADKSKLSKNERFIVSSSLETMSDLMTNRVGNLQKQYSHLMGEIDANIVEGSMVVRDNMGYIESSYSNLLNFHIKASNINPENIILLRNGNVRFQIIGEQGASRMIEYKQQLDRAKELEKEGKTPAQIELETGWYKYKGDWRTIPKEVVESFQIKDRTVNKELTLKQVLGDDSTIFHFYPEISGAKVVFLGENYKDNAFEEAKKQAFGFVDEKTGVIYINMATTNPSTGNREDVEEYEQLRTLAHEVNHLLQKIEGFPTGGNLLTVANKAMGIIGEKELTFEELYDKLLITDVSKLNENDKLIVSSTIDALKMFNTNNSTYGFNNQYSHLLGEIDSKIVEEVINFRNRNEAVPSYLQLFNRVTALKGIDLNNIIVVRGEKGGFKLNDSTQKDSKETVEEIITQLKKTGLSSEVFQLNTTQLQDKLKELEGETKQFIIDGKDTQIGKRAFLQTSIKPLIQNEIETNLEEVVNIGELAKITPNISYENAKIKFKKDDNRTSEISAELQLSGSKIDSITIYFRESDLQSSEERLRREVALLISHETQHIYDRSNSRNSGTNIDRVSETRQKVFGDVSTRVKKTVDNRGVEIFNENVGVDFGLYLANEGEYRARLNSLQEQGIQQELFEAFEPKIEDKYLWNTEEDFTNNDPQYYYDLAVNWYANTINPAKSGIEFMKNERGLVKGFVVNNQVYLNTDLMDETTPFHEFQHLLLNWSKEARPDIYNRGIELARKELEKGGVTVGENNENNELPSIDNILDIIEDEGLIGEDERFETKDEALEYANEIHSVFSEYYDMVDIPVYRAVKADEVDLDTYSIGESWSFSLQSAKEFARQNNMGNKMISGLVHNGNVDWESAVKKFMYLSDIFDGASEFELPIPAGNRINNVKVEDIKLAKERVQETSEIQDVIDYIRTTQPNLKGEALENEIITEFVGRYSKRMMDEQKAKSPLMQWLSDFWASVKEMLGITDMTPAQVANLTLEEYAKASVVTLSKGDNFTGKDGEANFNRWKGTNELVKGFEIQEVKTGHPIVAKVYHGTTHEFYEFDASIKGSIEGHLGKVNYFTSEYQDASQNYLSEGGDLRTRIDNYKYDILTTLENNVDESLEDEERDEAIIDTVSENYPNFDNSSLDSGMSFDEVAERIATNEFVGGYEKVLEVYVKLNNPLVLGNGTTWFDALEIDELYLQEATEEIADEYGITEDEAKDEYDYEIRDRAIEKQGDGNKVISALEQALYDNGYDQAKAFEILGDNYYESEVELSNLEKSIRQAELYDNYNGELASSQVIADFFKNLGFDGIILTDVSERFEGMRLSPSTSHIHVFDEYNSQIKLADGSNTTFNPQTPDIRFQKIVYDARVENRAEMFQLINDYGIVINNLYPKSKENEIKDKFDECRI